MYVVVIGGGRVGYFLARHLLQRGDEVTLIEKDSSRAEWLTHHLGSIVVGGDGDEMEFLSATGIERADAVVAVTGEDENNLVALQIAKHHFQVPLTIARINNPANVPIFQDLGIDQAISATEVILNALESNLSSSSRDTLPPSPKGREEGTN